MFEKAVIELVDLLEVRIGRGDFGVQFLGGLEARFHDRRREGMQLGAAGEQLAQRRRIHGVVFGHHPVVGVMPGLLENALIIFRQRIPLVEIDHGQQHGAAFPPAGIIVVRRDLVEAEPFIVIRTDPFGRIDGTFFQRGIDVATGELLRHATELLHDAPGKAANAEFQSLEIGDGIDLLAEPAAHLTTGIAGEQ